MGNTMYIAWDREETSLYIPGNDKVEYIRVTSHPEQAIDKIAIFLVKNPRIKHVRVADKHGWSTIILEELETIFKHRDITFKVIPCERQRLA